MAGSVIAAGILLIAVLASLCIYRRIIGAAEQPAALVPQHRGGRLFRALPARR